MFCWNFGSCQQWYVASNSLQAVFWAWFFHLLASSILITFILSILHLDCILTPIKSYCHYRTLQCCSVGSSVETFCKFLECFGKIIFFPTHAAGRLPTVFLGHHPAEDFKHFLHGEPEAGWEHECVMTSAPGRAGGMFPAGFLYHNQDNWFRKMFLNSFSLSSLSLNRHFRLDDDE